MHGNALEQLQWEVVQSWREGLAALAERRRHLAAELGARNLEVFSSLDLEALARPAARSRRRRLSARDLEYDDLMADDDEA